VEGRVVTWWRRIYPGKGEVGANLVEYALPIALIAAAVISAITLVGRKAQNEFDCVALDLSNAGIREFIEDKKARRPLARRSLASSALPPTDGRSKELRQHLRSLATC
jgi:Flp pilus assembly pilin Flp